MLFGGFDKLVIKEGSRAVEVGDIEYSSLVARERSDERPKCRNVVRREAGIKPHSKGISTEHLPAWLDIVEVAHTDAPSIPRAMTERASAPSPCRALVRARPLWEPTLWLATTPCWRAVACQQLLVATARRSHLAPLLVCSE